ncbi:MAG: hypothetical protein LBK63_01045 [Treponema sp.]|jgi:hypothetical protein|nr:hypothetical protein [Treponema sp.]
MKKLYAAVLLAAAVSLGAEDLSPRVFELGFNLGADFANNYISAAEVFKKTIEIDLAKEPTPLNFDFGAGFDFFINLNLKDKESNRDNMGFGIFAGLEALGEFSLSEDFQKFLQGNKLGKTYEGDIGTGGSVFLETGAHGYFHVKQFRISVRPSYYLPLAYMEPNTHYVLRTGDDGEVYVDFEYDLALYTPFDTGDTGDDVGDVMDAISKNPLKMNGTGGVDLGLAVDYPLLPKLTVGASLTHIPLVPAHLVNKTLIQGGKTLESDNLLDKLINGGDLGDLLDDKTVTSTHDDIQVFRPFKFGINAVYTPFSFKMFSLALIPQMGYAYNAIYTNPHSFEASAAARIGLFNIMRSNSLLGFTLKTGYEDKRWKHGLGLALNFRAVQIDLGVAVQSEDFVQSFKGAGLSANAGLRFGW